jgi:hypothetical protein
LLKATATNVHVVAPRETSFIYVLKENDLKRSLKELKIAREHLLKATGTVRVGMDVTERDRRLKELADVPAVQKCLKKRRKQNALDE